MTHRGAARAAWENTVAGARAAAERRTLFCAISPKTLLLLSLLCLFRSFFLFFCVTFPSFWETKSNTYTVLVGCSCWLQEGEGCWLVDVCWIFVTIKTLIKFVNPYSSGYKVDVNSLANYEKKIQIKNQTAIAKQRAAAVHSSSLLWEQQPVLWGYLWCWPQPNHSNGLLDQDHRGLAFSWSAQVRPPPPLLSPSDCRVQGMYRVCLWVFLFLLLPFLLSCCVPVSTYRSSLELY